MYSSATIGGMSSESGSRIEAQSTRLKQEYDRRLLQYEKDFDISLSRITSREKTLRESMLAYTERLRNISNARVVSDNFKTAGEHLIIRAKHIPKHRQLPKKRRPLSLDELIGANSKQDKKTKAKPKSASRLSLPSLPERLTKNHHKVKVSFLSASDLYDIVDYSLKNKTKRRNTSPVHQKPCDKEKEQENDIKKEARCEIPKEESSKQERKSSITRPLNKNERTEGPETSENKVKQEKSLNLEESLEIISSEVLNGQLLQTEPKLERPISKKDNSLKVISDDPLKGTYMTTRVDDPIVQPIKPDVLKKRPNRAKRMKLHEPELGAIPEGDVLLSQTKRRWKEKIDEKNKTGETVIVRRSLGKMAAKPDLEIILETEVLCPIKNDLIDSEGAGTDGNGNAHNSSGTVLSSGSSEVKTMEDAENEGQNNSASDDSNSNKLGPLKTKTRAQKRFKKLIFLRDIPEWYYQRM